jgi:serralysin
MATSLANALATSAPIASVAQVGGTSGDTFTYTLGGTGAAAFKLSSSGNVGTLTSTSGLAGTTAGLLYSLTVTANDTTSGLSSPAVPVNVIIGTSGVDTISVATLSANLGTSTPTFVYGRGSADTLNGSGMTGKLWFVGGGGADKMTGGSGIDTYIYSSTSDSASSAMDIITNFKVGVDRIDLTSLGALQYAGSIQSNGKSGNADVIAAHSVGWQTSGGNTFVYINTSSAKENITASNMKIELAGNLSPTSSNFLHA